MVLEELFLNVKVKEKRTKKGGGVTVIYSFQNYVIMVLHVK